MTRIRTDKSRHPCNPCNPWRLEDPGDDVDDDGRSFIHKDDVAADDNADRRPSGNRDNLTMEHTRQGLDFLFQAGREPSVLDQLRPVPASGALAWRGPGTGYCCLSGHGTIPP